MWFILSSILTPIGFVLQDVVADAMTVEVVEGNNRNDPNKLNDKKIKNEHTIVQLYGRFAIILGSLLVGLINLFVFNSIDQSYLEINKLYGNIYLIALIVPLISVLGVVISNYFYKEKKIKKSFETNHLDYKIFIGSCFFVFFAIFLGALKLTYSKEIVLLTSLFLISILMKMLMTNIKTDQRATIIGTAIIIFVYRSMPAPGPGLNWYEIDILGFNQSFFAVLTIVSATITLLGMLIFKKFMVQTALFKLFIILSIFSSVLYLPSLFLYYEFHKFTSAYTFGIVDERFIAIINTAVESPLSQVAMIPLLAWIAKNAPLKYKATFFAVFASFTNLALSARELFTSYLNKIFIIKRDIYEDGTNILIEKSDYTNLDSLLITIILTTLIIPIITIVIVQNSKFKSKE